MIYEGFFKEFFLKPTTTVFNYTKSFTSQNLITKCAKKLKFDKIKKIRNNTIKPKI